jgi:hypothetical protein
VRSQDQDEELGLLLLRTMSSTWAGGGAQFNRERRALRRRWSRLVRVLAEYRTSGSSAPWNLRGLDEWLHVVRVPTTHWLPAPPIPAAERAESDRRLDLIKQFSAELIREEGLAFPTPDDITALAALGKWQVEALPSRARSRDSSRRVVCRYLDEVGRFAERWRLAAWWAAPAIVHEHLMSARFGRDRLDLRMPAARDVDHYRLLAKLPKRTEEEFKRDVAALDAVMLEATIDSHGGPLRVLRPPSRDELAEIEQREDAASVIVDWQPDRVPDPASFVERACQKRLGRQLTSYESRRLRSQLAPQIRAGRSGWHCCLPAAQSGSLLVRHRRRSRSRQHCA